MNNYPPITLTKPINWIIDKKHNLEFLIINEYNLICSSTIKKNNYFIIIYYNNEIIHTKNHFIDPNLLIIKSSKEIIIDELIKRNILKEYDYSINTLNQLNPPNELITNEQWITIQDSIIDSYSRDSKEVLEFQLNRLISDYIFGINRGYFYLKPRISSLLSNNTGFENPLPFDNIDNELELIPNILINEINDELIKQETLNIKIDHDKLSRQNMLNSIVALCNKKV